MAKKRETKKNLLELAKTKVTPKNKKKEKTIDVKAKETVERLLELVDVDTPNESTKIIESDTGFQNTEIVDMSDIGWLQEQLQKLSEENETLKLETEEAKNNYKKLFETHGNHGDEFSEEVKIVPDSIIKTNIVSLFTDVQDNFQGRNPERTQYKNIVPVPFMMKMIQMFPFLNELKRF